MKTRIISALVMVPLLYFVYAGGWWLFSAAIILSFIAIKELDDGFNAMNINPSRYIGQSAVILLYLLHIILQNSEIIYLVWASLAVMASLLYGFRIEKIKIEDVIATVFGIFYISLLFFMILIDESAFSIMIWSVFLIAFGTDIFAYFVGSFIGKHKLCPVLSPKKSIEGAIGGVLGATILNGIFMYILLPEYFCTGIILSVIGSVFAQFGDLSASSLKRHMGIKDYGKLIPGHGGILDRFDSILFTAPIVYIYIFIAEYASKMI